MGINVYNINIKRSLRKETQHSPTFIDTSHGAIIALDHSKRGCKETKHRDVEGQECGQGARMIIGTEYPTDHARHALHQVDLRLAS